MLVFAWFVVKESLLSHNHLGGGRDGKENKAAELLVPAMFPVACLRCVGAFKEIVRSSTCLMAQKQPGPMSYGAARRASYNHSVRVQTAWYSDARDFCSKQNCQKIMAKLWQLLAQAACCALELCWGCCLLELPVEAALLGHGPQCN